MLGVSNINSTEECELNFSGQGWMCIRLFCMMAIWRLCYMSETSSEVTTMLVG